MGDPTDLDSVPLREPDASYTPLEDLEPTDTVDQLTQKFGTLVRVVGDLVIKEAIRSGDKGVLTNRDTLLREISRGIQYSVPEDTDAQFVQRLETAINQALASEIDFIHAKALAAGIGYALGLSEEGALGVGQAFAVVTGAAANASREQASDADPVTLFTGEFVHTAADLRVRGAGMDFEFVRTYSNQPFFAGPLGHNWDHCYNLWLRVPDDQRIIARSNGALREDLYVRHETLGYWVPPDGEDGVIVEEGERFVWRAPSGTRYIYTRDESLPFLFRIARVEDRFGNFLAFTYEDGRLQAVAVNHPRRLVQFTYGELGLIASIRDHAGREWRYCHDDHQDLVGVTTPGTAQHPAGLSTRYDYSSGQFTGDLQHNLLRMLEGGGRTYLENEYGIEPGSRSFNRVVRQRQGGGDTLFEYEDVIEEFDFDYSDLERPKHETRVVGRNGHESRHVFNRFGNLILRQERVFMGGLPRDLQYQFRYNRDGNLVASLTPEGVITQYLYGRDHFHRINLPFEGEFTNHPGLTPEVRQGFNRILTIVRRARYFGFTELSMARGVWGDIFPDILGAVEPDPVNGTRDLITKFTYEPVYGQLLTQSDPRFTVSPDPARQSPLQGEHERYEETVTRYRYDGPPGDRTRLLVEIAHPAPTQADGSVAGAPVESFRNADGTPAYDGRGRLLRRIDAVGTITEFQYRPHDPLDVRTGYLQRVIVDPGGLAIATEYDVDALGRVIEVKAPRSVESDGGRFVTRIAYDELDLVVETVASAPFSFRTVNRYDCNGLLARSERDLRGEDGTPLAGGQEVHTFCYNEEFQVVRETVGGADDATRIATTYRYDAAGQRVLIVQPNGNAVRHCYDARQLPVSQTMGAGSADASTTRIEYDGDGRTRRTTSARGHVVKYELDAFGRTVLIENALGHLTVNAFDKAGHLACVRSFESREDGYYLLARAETTHDELNRAVRGGVNVFTDPLGPFPRSELLSAGLASPGPGRLLVAQTFYDAAGRVVRTVDPLLRETRFQYDAAGRLLVQTDPLGNEVRSRYDLHDNVLRMDCVEQIRDAETGVATGQRVFTSTATYDELDRVSARTDSLGNTTLYAYDSRGSVTSRVDALGNRVRFEYDVLGRRVAQHEELTETGTGGSQQATATTRLEYDGNGNAVTAIDPRGRRVDQRYDALNRRRALVYPDGTEFRFEYDSDSNLVSTRDANGVERRFTLDALARVTRVDVDDSGAAAGLALSGARFEIFNYDGIDRCVHARNDFAACDYVYNSLGWTTSETTRFATPAAPFSLPLTVEREFNDVGVVTGLVYPGGRRIGLLRDELDRLTHVRNLANGAGYPGNPGTPDVYPLARMQYQGLQSQRCDYTNGTSSAFAYDGAGRLIEIVHGGVAGPLLRTQYVFDAAGRMRLRHDVAPGSDAAASFGYDSIHRLTTEASAAVQSFVATDFAPAAAVPPGPVPHRQQDLDALFTIGGATPNVAAYAYDLAGNREREQLGQAAPVVYATNSLDQYQSRGGQSFEYDRNGNLVHDGTHRYVYDSQDRLVAVEDGATGEPVARYFHDARGRRVLEIEGDTATHMLWDASDVIGEYRADRLFASYAFADGIDRPLQIAADGSEAWYHTDLVGSVRLLTGPAGDPVAAYDYSPFGRDTEAAGAMHNPVRYAGRRRSRVLETYDCRSRQYDPRLGRFLQRDPAGMVDGTNLYAYTMNSPLGFTDPWGTEARPEVNRDSLENYIEEERSELSRQAARRPQEERYTAVFKMYHEILQEIKFSAISGQPLDLNLLWEKRKRLFSSDWKRTSWMDLCRDCSNNPPIGQTGPFRSRNVMGVDTVAVFNAVASSHKPDPSRFERFMAKAGEFVAGLAFFAGPGLGSGVAMRSGLGGSALGRSGLRVTRSIGNVTRDEALAPLRAEAAGGARTWIVGPEGAGSTVAIRIAGNRITSDTFFPGRTYHVERTMGAIDNMINRDAAIGANRAVQWWSETHGTAMGVFGRPHQLEPRFLMMDRFFAKDFGWNVRSVVGHSRRSVLATPQQPTVYAWCYSTSCFVKLP